MHTEKSGRRLLGGKIWYIPETAVKPAAIVQPEPEMPRFAKRMAYHNQKNYHYGLYEYIQVYLAYSSSRMASNRLTMQQVQEVYRTNKIATTFEPVKVNDLIEILNHFLCVNHIMETIMTPLSANYIKKLHHLLTYGTFSDRKHRTGLGEFRTKDAKPGAPAKQITGQLGELIKNYEKRKADFNGILDFHARFELIHPFEDYNGRVGRVLILKECLRQGVDPFIIDDKRHCRVGEGYSGADRGRSGGAETLPGKNGALSADAIHPGRPTRKERPICAVNAPGIISSSLLPSAVWRSQPYSTFATKRFRITLIR